MESPIILMTVELVKSLIPVALVFILLALVVKRGKLAEAWQRCRGETRTNIGLFVVNYIILAQIYLIPVLAFHAVIPSHPVMQQFWEGLWPPLMVAIAIIVIDFASYWRHRFEHVSEMWRFHATHHADEAMTWFSLTRKHPVSRFLALLVDNTVLLLMGIPLWALLLANILRTWWGYFIHADVPWTLGPLGSVMVSPAAHRLHHIKDEALYGSNYGNTVTLWDKLFGTWVDPSPYLNCETGIEEGTRSLWGELKRPWEARYRDREATVEEAAV